MGIKGDRYYVFTESGKLLEIAGWDADLDLDILSELHNTDLGIITIEEIIEEYCDSYLDELD